MAEMILKNPRIKPADNGGYIVEYDRCMKSKDAYEGMAYMSGGTEVFEDGSLAIKRLDEIHKDSVTKVTSAALEAQAAKEGKEDKAEGESDSAKY